VHRFEELWLVPGLIEAHNHIAGGLGDLNDMVYQANPGLDTRATIDPDNNLVQRARTGGVTSMMLIPGSGTNISGFGTIAKSGGRTPDEAIVRSPGSLKIAQTGNPEWYFGGNWTRFMNWNTRHTLEKAEAYHMAWTAFEAGKGPEPEFSPFFDGFRGLFRGDYPATVHTQQYQVLMSTLRLLSGRFDIWTVLDHCTFDAWKLGPIVAADKNTWAMNGPRQFHPDFTDRRMIGNCSGWWKNGLRQLGVNTDAPVIPQQQLSYQGAMACWYGWLPYPALQGVTKKPAQALGLYDRTGSIEPGKDADFALWTGDPLDPRSACLMTVVNGQIEYDASKEEPRRF
jgi:imidazolonepropionase-like amidohydrolase